MTSRVLRAHIMVHCDAPGGVASVRRTVEDLRRSDAGIEFDLEGVRPGELRRRLLPDASLFLEEGGLLVGRMPVSAIRVTREGRGLPAGALVRCRPEFIRTRPRSVRLKGWGFLPDPPGDLPEGFPDGMTPDGAEGCVL